MNHIYLCWNLWYNILILGRKRPDSDERQGRLQTWYARYVTEDTELIGKLRKELADMRISELFEKLQQLGYGKREIKELLDSYFEELVEDGSISGV